MKRLIFLSVVLAFVGMAHVAIAEDKADPTGTWEWKAQPNQSAVYTLKLKLDGEKLTGSIQPYQNARESPIEDAAFKDGIVSFNRPYKGRDSQQMVSSYTGTINRDQIKGTIEIQHPDWKRTVVWYASRIK